MIATEKIMHARGVAEYMYLHADEFGLNDVKEELYAVGLLHVIGALRNRNKDDMDSADILRMITFPEKYITVIKANNISPSEYCKRFGVTDDEIPAIQILMWLANLTIDLGGEFIDPFDRVEKIERWHKEQNLEDSHSARETAEWLKARGYI